MTNKNKIIKKLFNTQMETITTKTSANVEGLCEHSVSLNLVKCCTNGPGIAFEKPRNQ